MSDIDIRTVEQKNVQFLKAAVRMLSMMQINLVLVVLALFLQTCVAEKLVFSHFMLGNTYDYVQDAVSAFKFDIKNAKRAKVDGFSLNLGSESWQLDRLDAAFIAAEQVGGFVVFVNLDIAVNGDKSPDYFVNAIMRNVRRSSQAKINGRPIVGTFLGHDKTFGEGSVNDGWQRKIKDPLKQQGVDPFFIPYFPFDARRIYETFPVADGFQMWDSTWPKGNHDINYDEDWIYAEHKGSRVLMSGVSPCFFRHFQGEEWQNRIFRSEATWHKRWMNIIYLNKADHIQIQTWNDFGESHYVGPVNPKAAFPSDATGTSARDWVDGMSHEAFYEMLPFYIQWYKTGNRPHIDQNQIFFSHRKHSLWLPNVNNDPNPKPAHWEWAKDVFMIESFVKDNEKLEFEVFVNGKSAGRAETGAVAGVEYHEIPFNDQAGGVELVIRQNGVERAKITGTYIQPFGGVEKWNFNLISRFVKF